MIETTPRRSAGRIHAPASPGVRLLPLPELADVRPMDAAERFQDLPGLALLESARPGRRSRWCFLTADPIDVIDVPADAEPAVGGGGLLFNRARRLLARLETSSTPPSAETPAFLGGLVGYVGYDLGRLLERLPTLAALDQQLPVLHLALYDWALAWDRLTGRAWLGGRAVDGDERRLNDRLAWVSDRLRQGVARPAVAPTSTGSGSLEFRSGLDRRAFEDRVEAIRDAIARGEIYQANLARRLETEFAGDPWDIYRQLRTGDPALFAAFLDLGHDASGARRGIVSASPEPFLRIDADANVAADPIKGTRRRGRTPEQDRALAAELLCSEKDRAENVMIVDVLRNDLGRVCDPGSVRVPRLLRLERTATVQHLVTTVTGRLAHDRDAFDLLTASFPGGSITGAPKLRAMTILEGLEPVRRGPYTGALGWWGPDGAMSTSILIRTFVADGQRLSLHVGGGITWRSNPADEWDETVAKASGPLGAIGGVEVGGVEVAGVP